jgi:hypothetical protein
VKWFCLTLLFCAFNASALPEPVAAGVQPQTFQSWKDLQVLEAQNQLLRAGARVTQVKSGKGGRAAVKEQAPLPSSRVKSAGEDPLALAEKNVIRAKESLEAANSLELSDYVNIYLPSLETQPEALAALLQKLSKEELSEILKIVLGKNSRFDTKRNAPVVGGLTVGPSTRPSSSN